MLLVPTSRELLVKVVCCGINKLPGGKVAFLSLCVVSKIGYLLASGRGGGGWGGMGGGGAVERLARMSET